MSVLSNSVFCSTEITLLRSCFKQAVEHSGSKCLLKIEKKESKKLVRDYIVEGLRQIIQNSSYEGHWKDERDHVLSMAHSWIFISWMNGSMGGENISENFTPINTTFYLEVVKSLKFEEFLIQVMYCVHMAWTDRGVVTEKSVHRFVETCLFAFFLTE